jgi:EmrB/QacA subfamily drug resistance transporter
VRQSIESAAPGRRSRSLLGALLLAGFGYSLVQSLVVPALPTLQHRLHTTQTGVTWVFTAFMLASAVALPLAGRLGDMFGRRRILLGALFALSLGILVAALTSSLEVMVAARALQGIGGAIFPLAFGIIRDELPREKVAHGTSWMSAVLGGGGVIGIVLAGPILDHLSYHWLYWLPLVVTTASLVIAYIVVPARPGHASAGTGVGWWAAPLLAGWLVCLLVAVSEGPHWGWRSAQVLGLFALAVLSFASWVIVEGRARVPLVDLRMQRIRGVWTTNAVAVLSGWGMYSAFVLVPEYVEAPDRAGGFGATVAAAGIYLVPWTAAVAAASSLSGRLSTRFGSRVPLVIGTAGSTVGFLWLIFAHDDPWQVYLAATILGAGTGFTFSSMVNLVIESVPSEQTGVATGMNILMRTIGGTVGTQLAATVLAATLSGDGLTTRRGFEITFGIGAAMLALATVAALAAPGDRRRTGRRVAPSAPVTLSANSPSAG